MKLIFLISTVFFVMPAFAQSLPTSARELALAGAYVAQVNESTALSINPAGIAPEMGVTETVGDLSFSTGSVELAAQSNKAEPFGLFISYSGLTHGGGLAWIESDFIDLGVSDPSAGTTQTIQITSEEFSLFVATRWSEHLKLGAAVRMLSYNSGLSPANGEDDATDIGLSFGAQATLATFNTDLTQFKWRLGANYQTDAGYKALQNQRNTPYQDLDIVVHPELITAGSNIEILWFGESLNAALNINTDYQTARYKAMRELFDNGISAALTENNDLELERMALGMELALASNDSYTWLMRAGASETKRQDRNDWSLSTRSAGLGVAFSQITIDFAVQKANEQEGENSNEKLTSTVLSIGYQF